MIVPGLADRTIRQLRVRGQCLGDCGPAQSARGLLGCGGPLRAESGAQPIRSQEEGVWRSLGGV